MSSKVLSASAFTASAFSAFLLLGAQGAQAGGCHGSSCYDLVQTPPVYGSVAESYVVRPAQRQSRVIPAEYDYVSESVLVQPERRIPRHHPAQYSTVSEKVMVHPGGKRWEVTTDAHGRTTGCWVYDKPRYAYQQRTVVVAPASTSYEVVPAVYSQRQRKVMVRPTQVVHDEIPAVYGTHHRKVLISPGSQHWARSRH